MIRALLLWVAGLLTLVPYGTYHLLFHAQRDEYAFWIVLVLFWIFGYWGLAGPILAAIKLRAAMRALERAPSRGQVLEAVRGAETREAAIDLIASENGVPRFVAAWIYRRLEQHIARAAATDAGAARGGPG